MDARALNLAAAEAATEVAFAALLAAVPTMTEEEWKEAEAAAVRVAQEAINRAVFLKQQESDSADANMVSMLRAACDEDDEKAARQAAEEAAEKEVDFDGVVYEKAW